MKLTHIIFVPILINLVLCGITFSQSTFFLDEDEQLSLIYQNNSLHGLGIKPLSAYAPEASFEEACEFALEELNTNLFISVFIEEFKANDFSHYNFPEFSINDTVLTLDGNIAKVDSFALNRDAYCIVGLKNGPSEINAAMPSIEELMVRPVKVGNTWFAIGKAKATRYNPTVAWMKAKNYALQELTKVLRTSVKSLKKSLEQEAYIQNEEITYFKSNLIYSNIYNVRRYKTQKSFVVVIAVNQNDVVKY